MGTETTSAEKVASAGSDPSHGQGGAYGLIEPQEHSAGYGMRGPDDDRRAAGGAAESDEAVPNQLIPEQPEADQSRPYSKFTLGKIGELAPHKSALRQALGEQ